MPSHSSPSSAAPSKKRLGALLLEKQVLTSDQLQIALTEQKRTGNKLGAQLVRLGFVTEQVLRDSLSEKLGQQSVDLSKIIVDPHALQLVSKDLAKRHQLLPVAFKASERILLLAMANPSNLKALDQIRAAIGWDIEIDICLASEADISTAIDRYYGFTLSIDGILREIETGQTDYRAFEHHDDAFAQPVVRLVDALLSDAVMRSASDIHFEPESSFVRIRYRIDGVLRQARCVHKDYWPAMVVRLKVMSGMNITETRAPQDGRIHLHFFGRPVDFRLATHPCTGGENIVLRILDRHKSTVALDDLGIGEPTARLLKNLVARPNGMVLVTGPTGAGKTTTLYGLLNHINSVELNIMTLEDPVEYELPLLRQTSISDSHKIDFAGGVRSLLRQDPDVILIGEIRDRETAEMAFRAAMTGHRVFSTLHCGSAIAAIPRLIDMGVSPETLVGHINAIIGQRLLRKLCPECKRPDHAEPYEQALLADQDSSPLMLWRPQGCESCAYQGFRGRVPILETLDLDEEIDDLIAARANRHQIARLALGKGFVPLAKAAIERVLDGSTTLSEVARTVDLTGRAV